MEQRQVSLFIEENLKTIYAYALSRVSNKEDAADLAEDIILEFFKVHRDYEMIMRSLVIFGP